MTKPVAGGRSLEDGLRQRRAGGPDLGTQVSQQ